MQTETVTAVGDQSVAQQFIREVYQRVASTKLDAAEAISPPGPSNFRSRHSFTLATK
jgi:hypothetical protein